MMTQEELDRLRKAYYSGVLKVREGDTWVEYQSLKQMRVAMRDAENELANGGEGKAPQGTRLARTGKGY